MIVTFRKSRFSGCEKFLLQLFSVSVRITIHTVRIGMCRRHISQDLGKVRLNRKLTPLLLIVVMAGFFPCPIGAQIPANAKVVKDVIARFQTGAEPVRVLFYSYQPRQQGIGFVVVSRSGKLLGKTEMPDANSIAPATGVYDVRANGTPDIILAGGVGAKSYLVSVYSFQDDQLKEIFNWSGWHFEVQRLGRHPVIAVTTTDYGTLPMLYRWKQSQFVHSDQDFPEFFDKAIKTQQDTIERSGFPAYVYAQACELGATALVYGKKYSQASDLCQHALKVVESSPEVIPNSTRPTPGELEIERQEAAARIQSTLNALQAAEQQVSSNLKQQ